VLGIFPRGWRVPLAYRREGVLKRTTVRLAALHRQGELNKLLANEDTKKTPEPSPDKPNPDAPEEEKKPKREPPHEKPENAKPATMPKIVASHFEKRDAYVNYYFNRSNQERVWKAFRETGDFAAANSKWTFAGELAGGGDFKLTLAENLGVLTLPAGESKTLFTSDLTTNVAPPGSGGLMSAVHLWQRLLREGPQRFGEVYYLGSRPLPPAAEHLDVLVGIYGGVETNFYFSPDDGLLVAMEVFGDDERDPAEIYFGDYQEFEGRWLPHRIEARYGDEQFAMFLIKEIKFEASDEK
jgi:hypothetical protein